MCIRDRSISKYLNLGSNQNMEGAHHDHGSKNSFQMQMETGDRVGDPDSNPLFDHGDILGQFDTPQQNDPLSHLRLILDDPLIQKVRTDMGMDQDYLLQQLAQEQNLGSMMPENDVNEAERRRHETVQQLYLKEQLIRSLLEGIHAQIEQLK
eukprot:TRINITY_DN0_c462_g1_i4.p1 TRINITY_DN0_c462_g1~~TRINITY_DN0_c462_g1_i4.p1  ORF type:complete len:152 (-),score=50.27 TRINITY_DN0_c462_g1_i4:94-549(-)